MRIVDLSQDIYEGMPVYPGHLKTVQFEHATHEETAPRFEGGFSFQTTGFMLNDNGPTHVDSFSHLDPEPSAETIEQMPLDLFYGPAVCLDVTGFAPRTDITAADLDRIEAAAPVSLQPGDILLLYTGTWNRFAGDKRYLTDFAGLGESAAEWIVSRQVKTFGVDSPTPDNPASTTYPVHMMSRRALIAAAAEMARDRGFEVLGAAPVRGQPGRLVWAQLLHDAGGTEEDSRGLLGRGDMLAASAALRALTAGRRRLIVIDDIDTGGQDAVEVLALVASRVVVSSTAVLAAAGTPLGVGRDLKLAGLAEAELGQVIGDMPAEQQRAVWVASGGMPGIARMLAGQLDGLPPGRDALVHLALHAAQRGEFLTVDDSLIRLLEKALDRTGDDGIRARLLARMSRELLGDPLAGPRPPSPGDQALTAAGRS